MRQGLFAIVKWYHSVGKGSSIISSFCPRLPEFSYGWPQSLDHEMGKKVREGECS